jgi:L-ascorbate metabolism protein UlaG (beta-lactamase superfamily)
MQFTFRWLGNAGFEFRLGDIVLMIDPFLTRPKLSNVYCCRVAPDLQAIKTHSHICDHILVSHTHFDHFMDVPEIAIRTGAVVHGSSNTCELALKLGLPEEQIHRINAGDEFSIGEIMVRVIHAAHPWIPGYTNGYLRENLKLPLRLRDYRMDSCLSFLISFQGKRILVWNSIRTDYAEPANVFICRAVSDQLWYTRIMKSAQPRLVIPSHWDDMFRPLTETTRPFFSVQRLALPLIQRIDLRKFEGKIKKANPECKVLIPERGKEYSV